MGMHADVVTRAADGLGPGRSGAVATALTGGFGIAVAMWGVGYAGRLPALLLPSPVVLALLLACAVAGGVALRRYASAGPGLAAAAGAVTGTINLLVLGSFLAGPEPGRLAAAAAVWIPASIAVSAALVAAGAVVAPRLGSLPGRRLDAPHAFAGVAVAATAVLLAAGGVVTSAQAGLAVHDWPTSFGYNMFLYPFARMTGGIYFEHAHRLLGALVGLTTVTLAAVLQATEPRARVRWAAWGAVPLVVLQGVLGGLRVTDRSLGLAVVHGILAQLFFALLVALFAWTSPAWRSAVPVARASARGDRVLSAVLPLLLLSQLALGAAQRHLHELLLVHVVTGIAIVAPLALHVGIRAWGLNPDFPRLQRLGLALLGAVLLQVLLGFGAWVGTGGAASGTLPMAADLVLATAHQWFGAVLLALAVTVTCWTRRLVRPV